MPKSGPTAETTQAKKQLRKAVQEILPPGISLENKTKEIERNIEGAVIGIEIKGRKVMEAVTQLLLTISKSRNSN
jgi:hypothetical protein